jgi:hypothetical protein
LATDADLKAIGKEIDLLVQLRNKASYNLRPLPEFASAAKVTRGIQQVASELARLDAINGDPVRRAAAIATIRP